MTHQTTINVTHPQDALLFGFTMAYTSGQQRAISHRDWSRKKAPISRVGSYDFNGTVDRATMKMHMAAADRPMSTHSKVLTLWPLSSTAIDKTECFAVREREVLWTMRAGKGMGRTTDGRMKALSSLNYFRLVLEDWQLEQLKGIINNAVKGTFRGAKNDNDTAMQILTALVGDNRMNDTVAQKIKIDDLNKIDEHLRHYVLANIQYAGVVITGEEPGSRQSLQGIAVTVGGLNTLANNGDKTLCPGMKLCMTVPRCVPDSTQWPAPCDHIGLPHGKVTPILRQADAQDLTQTILGGTQHIHTQVARMMSGCGGYASADEMKKCEAPEDVFFAFMNNDNMEFRGINAKDNGSGGPITEYDKDTTNRDFSKFLQMELMRRMNDAVVFTMHTKKARVSDLGSRASTTTPYVASDHANENEMYFGTALSNRISSDTQQVRPIAEQVTPMYKLLIIAFGNVRDVVMANYSAFTTGSSPVRFIQGINRDGSAGSGAPMSGNLDKVITNGGIAILFDNGLPTCLLSNTDANVAAGANILDPDARHFAALMVTTSLKVQQLLNANNVAIQHGSDPFIRPSNIKYYNMQAVSNGNAAFGFAAALKPRVFDRTATASQQETALAEGSRMQPNIVVLDKSARYPWDDSSISNIILANRNTSRHSRTVLVFRHEFQAPVRCDHGSDLDNPVDTEFIEVSDNEVPFVGAWVAMHKNDVPDKDEVPYRSNYALPGMCVKQDGDVHYYYMTWSAVVHLTCHNVLQSADEKKKVLEMNRAMLVRSPHYKYDDPTKSQAFVNDVSGSGATKRRFGAPGLGSYLQAILKPDTNDTTKYQDYLRKHSPIASLVNSVIRATVEAVTQHQLATDKKTVGMALSSAGRGEAVDVCLTGSV